MMTIVLEKNDYTKPASAREEAVQMIVDAFIQKINDMEDNWEYAEQQCLKYYEREDNGIYVYSSISGKPLISTRNGKGHIKVTNEEMDIAFDCLKRGGYYCYGTYNLTYGLHTYWWCKKPSFLGHKPLSNPKFSPFID